MKIVTTPTAYLVGRSQRDEKAIARFLEDHDMSEWVSDAPSDAELLSEMAGRTCYMSFQKPRPGGNAAYLQHIKESGHGSVLEHPVWNFILTGISRTCTHELVRHRAGWAYCLAAETEV